MPTADQRLVTYNVPWSHYETQLALRGDRPVPRMAYLEGALELMSPSKDHERVKSYLGCLVEAYALERGIDLSPYGAWTLKNAPKQSSAEPDECYIVRYESRSGTRCTSSIMAPPGCCASSPRQGLIVNTIDN